MALVVTIIDPEVSKADVYLDGFPVALGTVIINRVPTCLHADSTERDDRCRESDLRLLVVAAMTAHAEVVSSLRA